MSDHFIILQICISIKRINKNKSFSNKGCFQSIKFLAHNALLYFKMLHKCFISMCLSDMGQHKIELEH